MLDLPPETRITGLDWSPITNTVVGTLTGDEGTYLWLWDAEGGSLGALVELPNPDDEILTVRNPVWSPDGAKIAFELYHWYWWGESRYKTDLMSVSADGGDLRILFEADWGADAKHPSWSSDGNDLYYQLSTGAPEDDYFSKTNGDIGVVLVSETISEPLTFTAVYLTEDGASYLPAARPIE